MMGPVRELLQQVRARIERDRKLGWSELIRKGLRFARETASAPLYLRGVTTRGAGVRTLGRPRVENLGRMHIGEGTLLRSVNVPVELATGPDGLLEIGREVRLNYGVSVA